MLCEKKRNLERMGKGEKQKRIRAQELYMK
jgi:hypothetical protein